MNNNNNITEDDLIDVFIKMVDFCDENYINLINFTSVELIDHIMENSVITHKNDMEELLSDEELDSDDIE
jgi:hypothetical protein